MKRLSISLIALVIAQVSNATDLRGRVDGLHPYASAPFPMAGIQVTIFRFEPNPYGGMSWIPKVNAVTGSDGMYYFRGVPPGDFILQVSGTNYPLKVLSQPAQDIQAILVRF